jgi:hypothetical protein
MDRSRLRLVSCILIAAAGLSFGFSAESQTPSAGAVGLERSKEADRLFDAGKSAYKLGKTQEAYEAYRDAWTLKPTYDICSNLANTEVELGKRGVAGMKRAAAEHYGRCISLFPPSNKKLAPAQAETLRRFEAARADVAALDIKVNVPDAEVFVDGASIGKAPFDREVYVDPGERDIAAKLAGYEMTPLKVLAVQAKPNGTQRAEPQKLELTLAPVKPREAETKPPPVDAGVQPVESAPLDAGTATPPPGGGTEPARRSTPIVITGAAIGAVAIGIGGALLGLAQNKTSDGNSLLAQLQQQRIPCASPPAPGSCQQLLSLRQDEGTFHNVGVPLLVGGGIVAVGTLVYVLVPRPKVEKRARVQVAPVVTARGGGLSLGGSF